MAIDQDTPLCSIERTLDAVRDRWSFLILREALVGEATRFADFQRALGVAPNVLTDRLARLVDVGVLERRDYREPGSRSRPGYYPTPAGRELAVAIAALQQWGDAHLPRRNGPTVARTTDDGQPVHVGFIAADGTERDLTDVRFVASPELAEARAAS